MRTHRSQSRSSGGSPWISLLGGLIGLLVVCGLVWSLLPDSKQTENQSDDRTEIQSAPDAMTTGTAEVNPSTEINDAAFLKLAEPMARAFIEAKTIAELEPLVWMPERAMERIRKFYPDGVLPQNKLLEFDTTGAVERNGAIRAVGIRTGDYREGGLAYREKDGTFAIDWESWVGWSEMPVLDFIRDRVLEPKKFRVLVTPVDYYNFAFRDDLTWMSCRIEFPDREEYLYGYVERDTAAFQELRQEPQEKRIPMILELAFPPGAERENQVLIIRHIADGWIDDNTESSP